MTPLTPHDCDLRAFPTMPMDAVRLFGSEFHAVASDAAWRAGVTLWLRSWHQMPAASLPDDDVQLARLAELGKDVKAWAKIRAQALHGWVKCDDGRLYHPVVAEMAMSAWAKRKAFKERSAKASSRRWASKKDGVDDAKALLQGDDKESLTIPKGEGEERDNSVDKSTAAGAVDPVKYMFDVGIAYLASCGLPEARSRPMLGKWNRDYGAVRVLEAIGAAQRQGVVDPVSWIEARWRAANDQGVGRRYADAPC